MSDHTHISSCEQLDSSEVTNDWERKRQEALKEFCADPDLAPLMEVTVDNRFYQNYKTWYGEDGWIDKAWVNYLKVDIGHNNKFAVITKQLAESIALSSQYPLIIFNFGTAPIGDIDPKDFPNVVILNAKSELKSGTCFHLNTLRAILVARVKTGLSVDSDMLMMSSRADNLLQRTQEEIDENYPLPMMPTHFLHRDPRDGSDAAYDCKKWGCPDETLRWGQAQPSWTYWSLPFLSRWLAARLKSQQLAGVQVGKLATDEDLLNVGLWTEAASKAWCMFQPGGYERLYDLVGQHPNLHANPNYPDNRNFPEGVPVAFYFIHDAKDPKQSKQAIDFIKKNKRRLDAAKPIVFLGKFYDSLVELRADHPQLKCLV